jgi:hypothetical protein
VDANPTKNIVRAYLGMPLIVRAKDRLLNMTVRETRPVCRRGTQTSSALRTSSRHIEHLRLIASLVEERQHLTILNRLSHRFQRLQTGRSGRPPPLDISACCWNASQGNFSNGIRSKQLSIISGRGFTPGD